MSIPEQKRQIFFFRFGKLDEEEISRLTENQARHIRRAIFCLKEEETQSIDITGYVPAGLNKDKRKILEGEMSQADLVVIKETGPVRIIIQSPSPEEIRQRTYEATLDPQKELVYTWDKDKANFKRLIVSPYNYVFGNPARREQNFCDLMEKVENVDQIEVRDIVPDPK